MAGTRAIRTVLGALAAVAGTGTPLVGFVAALAQRRELGMATRPGRLLGATLVLTATSWWLAFTAVVGAAAWPFVEGAFGAPAGVAVGMLVLPDLRFVAAALMLDRPSLGFPASAARALGPAHALRAAAWPVVGAALAAAWLSFVPGPWRLAGPFVGFGVAPLAAAAWAKELARRPAAHLPIEARDAGRYAVAGVVAVVLALALAEPSSARLGALPAGHAAIALPRSLAGTDIVIERDPHGVRVVARDGGGAGPVRTPAGRPGERARIARTAEGHFDVEVIDGAGHASLVALTADGVRLDDAPGDRLRSAFGVRGLVALLALLAFLAVLAFAPRREKA